MYTFDIITLMRKNIRFGREDMIIAFCGHAKYKKSLEDEKKILEILEKRIGNTPCEFFLGEYGDFDCFAYECVKKFKKNHPDIMLVFITPYLSVEYKKNYDEYKKDRFDLIIYPELENVPRRYAISYRNRWIADHANIIIAYIDHEYGGAYTMYKYAKRKNKEIYNIAQRNID